MRLHPQQKNSSQTIGDLNCFMTGNELNYAFQQTVSYKYTFGSGDKLIDSFPPWPSVDMKFFNPYIYVRIFYEIDESIDISGAGHTAVITNSGIYTSFNSSEYSEIDVKLKIHVLPDFIEQPFYYNDKEYNGSDVSFHVVINNAGNRTV